MSFKEKLTEWLGWRSDTPVPPDVQAEFVLEHGDLVVGTLSVSDGLWRFEYSDEFKKRTDLRPIFAFPDLDETYQKAELWQFFASRIPSVEQPDIESVLQKEHIADDDVVALLKRFGRRTISNPFELRFREATTS